MPSAPLLRKLGLADMDEVARVHRIAFDDRLPWLAGLHAPEADRRYFRQQVFPACEVWGAIGDDTIIGFIAFRRDWIDQLYVLPSAQRRRVGSVLLGAAKAAFPRLWLWTFQRNLPARRFYERRGFVLIEETDGARNEEREPDTLYAWSRS